MMQESIKNDDTNNRLVAEIFSALASAKINIYLISQGSNEINISWVLCMNTIYEIYVDITSM